MLQGYPSPSTIYRWLKQKQIPSKGRAQVESCIHDDRLIRDWTEYRDGHGYDQSLYACVKCGAWAVDAATPAVWEYAD